MLLCLPLSSSFAKSEPVTGNIKLGVSGIKTNDKVYFGSYLSEPIAWQVIGSTVFLNTSVASGTSVLSLLSEHLLASTTYFSSTYDFYPNSGLQVKIDSIYNGFITQEKDAVVSTTLFAIDTEGGELSNQKLFALSEPEALEFASDSLRVASFSTSGPAAWWLRTSRNEERASYVTVSGMVSRTEKSYSFGVRPAFHLDQSAVIFSSALTNGKRSAGVGSSAMVSVSPADTASEWKLTLLDKSRSGFSISTSAISGSSASIDYTGAKTGENEYLSAIIEDQGSVIYYGRILQLDGTTHGSSGSATINIPSGITLDADTTLKIFNEQYNSDASESPILTDYSSALKSATLPADIPSTGDSSLLGLWLGIALAAIVGLAASVLIGRKIKRVGETD